MGLGNLVKDPLGVPVSQTYVPGLGWVILQGSLLTSTDGGPNQSTGIVEISTVMQAVLNGQMFSAIQSFNVGGSGTGYYFLSLFNPLASGKSLLLISAKGWMQSNTNPILWLFKKTADPTYNLTCTPTCMKLGGGTSAASATANTGVISAFPGDPLLDTSCNPSSVTGELCTAGVPGYFLPVGVASGVELMLSCPNSVTIGMSMKWIEF